MQPSQTTVLPGDQVPALLVAEHAKQVMALTTQLEHIETLIEERFSRHELADVITSMPAIGILLGPEAVTIVCAPRRWDGPNSSQPASPASATRAQSPMAFAAQLRGPIPRR
jgi:hypothetical protein